MLVDALREDFVFGPNGRMYMPYTRHVVERGSSNSFVAKARPPTVTMPRIKVSPSCVNSPSASLFFLTGKYYKFAVVDQLFRCKWSVFYQSLPALTVALSSKPFTSKWKQIWSQTQSLIFIKESSFLKQAWHLPSLCLQYIRPTNQSWCSLMSEYSGVGETGVWIRLNDHFRGCRSWYCWTE